MAATGYGPGLPPMEANGCFGAIVLKIVSGLISKKRGRLDAALCQGLRARSPPDPKQRTTDTSKMEKKLTSVFCVDNAVGARSKCHPDS
jgi:hypothetical protein